MIERGKQKSWMELNWGRRNGHNSYLASPMPHFKKRVTRGLPPVQHNPKHLKPTPGHLSQRTRRESADVVQAVNHSSPRAQATPAPGPLPLQAFVQDEQLAIAKANERYNNALKSRKTTAGKWPHESATPDPQDNRGDNLGQPMSAHRHPNTPPPSFEEHVSAAKASKEMGDAVVTDVELLEPPTAAEETDTGYATAAESEAGREKRTGKRRIRVVVRKRPMPEDHLEDEEDCVETEPPMVHIRALKQRVDLSEYTESHDYTFDDAFGEGHKNADVYSHLCRPLIDCVFEGGSASCFAFGQTGSGKTHTLMGTETEPGLYTLGAEDLFARVKPTHRVFVSLYEIYCNSLFDLLNHRAVIVTREDANKKVNVCGLTWHEITNVRELVRVIDKGAVQRRTGSTSANEFSSRSHAVLTMSLRDEAAPKFNASLNFVDLAGSERAADTAANDKQTRLEGAEINKSLLALKECIRGLDERKKHIPFRGSKLTEVLRDSFVGNSRTLMIATISPSSLNVEHTQNTLRYAHRVKGLSIECPQPSKERNAPRPRFKPAPVVVVPEPLITSPPPANGIANGGISATEAAARHAKRKHRRKAHVKTEEDAFAEQVLDTTEALPSTEMMVELVEKRLEEKFSSKLEEIHAAMEKRDATILELLQQNQRLLRENEELRHIGRSTYHDDAKMEEMDFDVQ